jgi:O-antigen ligase
MTSRAADPALVSRRRPVDAVSILTVFIVLLFAIPSKLVFAPLGGAGSPAQLTGLVALLLWASAMLSRRRAPRAARQPVRLAMLVFVGVTMLSYVAATIRPIDELELAAADRGLLMLFSWLGIVLIASDGISSQERLMVLLRRLAAAGGAVGLLGILQFETGMTFTNLIQIPGLSESGALAAAVGGRDGFSRPAGTAVHPIEYGIVLTMLLPIAIHVALADRSRPTLRRWAPVAFLAAAVPISISRSAIVCSIVMLAFLVPTWAPRLRRRAYVAIAGLAAVMFVAVPGIIGTLVGLFSGIGTDTSAQSRTGSYAIASEFIARAPLLGRGFQTFLPAYHILDNQYLLTTIEAGFIGLAALLGLFFTGIVTARRGRRLSGDPDTRQLGQALAASLAAGAASFALFDALSFPQVASLVMLTLGLIGAYYRLQQVGDSLGEEVGETL